jgi:hypothetical protein
MRRPIFSAIFQVISNNVFLPSWLKLMAVLLGEFRDGDPQSLSQYETDPNTNISVLRVKFLQRVFWSNFIQDFALQQS